MNILTTQVSLSAARERINRTLQSGNLGMTYMYPVCRDERQYRYTIRRLPSGCFVAWFCWYVEPAVCRPHASRPRREHHVAKCITDDLSRAEVRLIEGALLQLMHLHPVTSG